MQNPKEFLFQSGKIKQVKCVRQQKVIWILLPSIKLSFTKICPHNIPDIARLRRLSRLDVPDNTDCEIEKVPTDAVRIRIFRFLDIIDLERAKKIFITGTLPI